MLAVQTLADILLVLFAHPNVSVADLLKCERICKQWCILIRSNQNQIWRQKLVDGFPEGCVPVRYGNEVWRDVTTLWWAWRRPWASADGTVVETDVAVGEVGVSETLKRRSDGVIRDMVAVYQISLGSTTQGLRPDGQVIIAPSPPKHTYVDIAFTETQSNARPITNIAGRPDMVRTTIIATLPGHDPEGDIVLEDWDTGTLIGQFPSDPAIETVCGSQITLAGNGIHIASIKDTSPFTISSQHVTHAINETVLAYLATVESALGPRHDLVLLRLADKSRIASFAFPEEVVYHDFWITRFNVFLLCETECLVFDLKLHLLHKLPADVNFQGEESSISRVFDWGIVLDPYVSGGVENVLLVADPKVRKYTRVVVPYKGSVLERGQQNPPANPGYYFATMEYPLNDGGSRTGAGGVLRHYWRELKVQTEALGE
ncbi:hypothetical protein HDV00_000675 [Rhizophlyctis rosea]|nr:hypothetical protein HDV00_000675 [Rhizophlyctis rosea]